MRDVRAAEPDGWLRWRAPADCPRAAEVEARVATLLGGSASAAAELRVVGEVRRDGQRWVLRLVARRGGGAQRRTLYHEDCAVLGEAAALLVALAAGSATTQVSKHPVAGVEVLEEAAAGEL